MKKLIRLMTGLVVPAAVSSCMAAFDAAVSDPIGIIHGTVTDTDGNPLNHIKVVLDYGEHRDQMTVYTSLKGEFIADVEHAVTTINLTLEDIDGEENGGLFAPLTDQITILEDNIFHSEGLMNLEYRLTRATASENSPQS